MFNELAIKMQEYLEQGANFAIAQVIGREAPSSSKVTDKAIILESGELIGWIGGGCVRGIVIKEALDVIRTKRYRRVRISPEGGLSSSNNIKNYIMSCQSGGTVEVMIEPVFPLPELIVVGKSNIARKLAAIATTADFKVTAMAKDADKYMFPLASVVKDNVSFTDIKNFTNTYIVIATQGEDDEENVEKALSTAAKYVGYVCSSKKSDLLKQYLTSKEVSPKRIDALKSPVGFDINAKLAGEVAISILAEIVDDFRNEKPDTSDCCGSKMEQKEEPLQDEIVNEKFTEEYYINPVCGVPVSKKSPKHIVSYKGENVYFCCDGCKVSFEKNPTQYIPE